MDRRNFMQQAVLASSGLAAAYGLARASEPPPGKNSTMDHPGDDSTGPSQIPATLDLAHHGELAINGILGCLNPAANYEATFLTIGDTNPPYMLHWSTMVSGVMPKFVEALPLMRLMSGSDLLLDWERGFMDAMVENATVDGMVYDESSPERPWNVGVYYGNKDWDESYANMAGNGRLISGWLYLYQLTGDNAWLDRARRTTDRMLELAIADGDYAWYPNPGLGNDFSYPRKSGWTTRKPPEKANEGFEGATLFYLCQPLRGLTRYHKVTGDERSLDMAQKMARFALQEKFWGGKDGMNKPASAERGHFEGHFHGTLAALRGILDCGVAADNQEMKLFARNGFEWARHYGCMRLGVFPHIQDGTEGCTIADMLGLAVALTDAGLGDYWDDVEMIARNGLVSVQATDLDELRRVSEAGKVRPANSTWGGQYDTRFRENNRGVLPGQEIHENVMQRTIGQFGHLAGAKYLVPQMMACCTGNCSQSLYIAWEGILRHRAGITEVNMWLNRRSPWADVWSSLPHEGRVMIINKGSSALVVRKPAWAAWSGVSSTIDGKPVEPRHLGSRLFFDGLRGNEIIVIEAPVRENSAECTLVNLNHPNDSVNRYDCSFRGHTAVAVTEVAAREGTEARNWYRLFRRDDLKSSITPMRAPSAYVSPANKLIELTSFRA